MRRFNENAVINIEILENVTGRATDKFKENSLPGPGGIPAISKKTKMTITNPLMLLMMQSLDKQDKQIFTKWHKYHPNTVHKGGSKLITKAI